MRGDTLRGAVRRWETGLRDARRDFAFEVVRLVSALFAVASLASASVPDDVRTASTAAHLTVVAVSLAVVALLPAATRRGWAPAVGLGLTLATIAFYVVTSVAWHDVAGAGTALGVLALLEAPIRYGWRGAALSGFPVLWTALLVPQVDASGETLSDGVVITLVALLLAAALGVREVMRRSATALAGAASGFAEAMLHLPLGVAVLDGAGRVLQANPALTDLVGPLRCGDRLADRLGPEPALAAVLAGDRPDDPVVCSTAAGRELEVGGATVHVPGPRRTVVHLQDVTDERRERRDLLHASRHDPLTGLLTRAAGGSALAEALDAGQPTGVLFLDLDGFKALNDTSGHEVGDAVLRQVAGRLAWSLREHEHAVRWGGDEFVVVCPGTDDAALAAVAERLLTVLREPFAVPDGPLVRLSASIGAVRARPGDDLGSVMSAADRAMYTAKRAGGDRWSAAVPGAQPEQGTGTISLSALETRSTVR